jgi:hypothetical protein
MGWAGVNSELLYQFAAEPVLGQHSPDRQADHPFWVFLVELAGRCRFDSTHIAAVAVISFLVPFVTGQPDLLGVDHDYEFTQVHVRSEIGQVFASDADRDLTCHAAQNLILGVNNYPFALLGFEVCALRFHRRALRNLRKLT